MTAIKAPATVLVTGASGFIAVWVVKTFLEAGYSVRGTVRSASKGDYLVNLFKSHGDKFQYVIVEDIAKEGAFDEAVKGVDAITHTASPFHFQAEDPQMLIEPAVKGTLGILASAHKYAPTVQRIVITSSVAAIVDPSKPSGTVFTENDWNSFSLRKVETKGNAAAGGEKYRASKTLAEKAAWTYLEEKRPKYDIATINPPMVFGPILHQVSNPESLNTSVALLYKILQTKESDLTREVLLTNNLNFVDVRDVALAHLRALEIPEAGGQRFITAGGAFCWQDPLDALQPPNPRGIPGIGKGLIHSRYDASKATKVLGISFKNLEESVRDTEEGLRQRGWGVKS
ncbi:NADPH-dependent aldehyde reductase ARI1 [Saccharomyces cerevisiae S288c] [Rhizoctonia solani]|uniref:NADPH-dependent aldehyde reductase ARI1 [Saccharomyces cerevisiae S288c] n=1 Tax=Rhizoctonia solani TaxID=456999 RepID=A0A0K6GEG6_9AGAM|nr:NADPH-dependent aldehyde reductase ARI1 [Saccharomyces cerevisiae S288c] [Rhizoctonia solani]